jgi:alkylation response protein AidB-like acyl-CoA dehydrogenase
MAKAWVSDAYRRVTRLGHQIHGGIGFCLDHNMPLYFKHCKAAESLFGGPEWHREKVAQELGL